ncbi:glutathione S-transferase N-terminal domain-containing protein [Litorivicinus sp.]|nr:glutathione S-transferase N-terminal domain-containing protein [Litorivicinus sp.]
MKLYCTLNSPFARKIRVLILELGAEEAVQVIEADPRDLSGPVCAANPLAKVPVLVTESGEPVIDSPVISEYLFDLSNTSAIATYDLHDKCVVAMGDGIVDAGYAARIEKLRPAELQWPDWIETQFGKINRALDLLETDVSLLSEKTSLGAIALACAVEWIQFRHPEGRWLDERPKLAQWVEKFSHRPSMVATRPVLPA